MAVINSLNPPALVAAVADLLGEYDCYYAIAPDDAEVPYLLIGYAPESTSTEPSVGGVPDSYADELYLTVVDITPGNVDTIRQGVRQLLNPGGSGRLVVVDTPAFRAWLKRSGVATAVGPDRGAAKLVRTNDYPMYAMDSYSVHILKEE